MDRDFESMELESFLMELESFLMEEELYSTMEATNNAYTTFNFDDQRAVQPPEIPQEFDYSDLSSTSLFADPPLLPSFSPQDPKLGSQGEKMLQEKHLCLQQNQQEQVLEKQQQEEEEEDVEVEVEVEGEGEGESDAKKQNGNEGTSRNIVFERKRRKRLNQQLMTLRSLVPNITKMDKSSILIDAHAYLQNVLQQIDKEMEKPSLPKSSTFASSSLGEDSSTMVDVEAPPLKVHTQEFDRFACIPAISKIEGDILGDERFILKIWCNKGVGAVGLVERAIEMLGLQITCASIDQFDNANMVTTTFLRSKKKGVFTLEKLLKKVKTNATELGLWL
ncbi:transcription factor bHLH35-like [Telopea speciosissima]|uniref:transcription factor bHLH35-like n=1 Tax=Telopea speciosissima TaxID=54955 RepID=UPI001CC56CFE|nr:transcription factor bHLH35-like [Telopea speciosissima]